MKIHINEDIDIKIGKTAEKAFENENDLNFFSENEGVIKTSRDRWEKAQRTEHKHWFVLGNNANDDRNLYHLSQFNNYSKLKNKHFKNALEIGCGPFTNLRLIGNYCKIDMCSLNDPMVNEYIQNHPYCRYNSKYLVPDNDYNSFVSRQIKNKYLARPLLKKIKVNAIYATPFEELRIDKKFDLIIIINVIEHCYDLKTIFQKILDISDNEGYLIFSDKMYDIADVAKDINNVYDAAHPLRVNKEIFLEFLNSNFEAVYSKIVPNKTEISGIKFEWEDIYFIGKKNKVLINHYVQPDEY
jgi:SAM-dependent methyltransferase